MGEIKKEVPWNKQMRNGRTSLINERERKISTEYDILLVGTHYNLYEQHAINCVMLLLSCFSHVWLCATPQMAANQAPLSLGFSRQEHWSGLPFPSSMHESEKSKWIRSVSVRLFVTPWTTAYQAPPSVGFSRQGYWSGLPLPSPKRLSSIL